MAKLPDLKKFGNIAITGLAITAAPGVARSILIESLKDITFEDLVYRIQNNEILWDEINPEAQERVSNVLSRLGNLEWLNASWVIESIKDDYPLFASLFMDWSLGREWVENQIAILKRGTG